MGLVLWIAAAQDPTAPEELQQILQEVQLAMEAERGSPTTEISELSPMAAVEFLVRTGSVHDLGRLLEALVQLRASGATGSSRAEAGEERLRRDPIPPTTLRAAESGARAPSPRPARERTPLSGLSLAIGGTALAIAALLWMLRKEPSA